MNLKISESESLPLDFLSLRNVVYGGSGAGKTAFGRVIFEESVKCGIVPGVIDLKADWWGLKSSADGKSDGLPVVIFGGDHADVPIHENGGAELAEILAELRQPFIVDLENFSKTKQLKFLAPFFDRLYDKNRHPLKLICDESDRYIPQRILTKDPNAAICLGAGEDIAKRGRKHGIFAMFISQRNADLNKSVTELCDVATVFRTSGPNDQKAVNDWFEAKGSVITSEQREQVMQEIAGMQNGEEFFCSAHPHLKMFKKVQIRMPWTFDSSATPEIGKELLQPKKFAKIELDKLGERMKATIETAKANDPVLLKSELKRLNAEIQKLSKQATAETIKTTVEVPVLSAEEKNLLRRVGSELEIIQGKLQIALAGFERAGKLHAELSQKLERISPPKMAVSNIGRQPITIHAPTSDGEPIGKCERAILTFLVDNYPNAFSAEDVGQAVGYSHNSGGFNNALSRLRTLELITRGQPMKATDEFFQ
jgi:hypothetical protein